MCWREKERQWQRQWQFFNDFRPSAQSHREREREWERERETERKRGRGRERDCAHVCMTVCTYVCMQACVLCSHMHDFFIYFFISFSLLKPTNIWGRSWPFAAVALSCIQQWTVFKGIACLTLMPHEQGVQDGWEAVLCYTANGIQYLQSDTALLLVLFFNLKISTLYNVFSLSFGCHSSA